MRNHVSHTGRCYLPIGSVTFFPNMVSCCSYNGLKSECSSLYEHIIFNHQYCIPPSHVQVKPPVWTGVCYRIARLCFHSSLLVSVKVLCLSVHTLNQDIFFQKRKLVFILHLIYHTFLISPHL